MAAMNTMMVLMAVLMTGGRGDVLSVVPTDAYWQSKNVTVSAETMLAELKTADATGRQPADKSQEIRRLMAIRTLGELKAKEAVTDSV